jgi:hypothetical protein
MHTDTHIERESYHINITFRDLKENELYSFSFFTLNIIRCLLYFLHDLTRERLNFDTETRIS